MYYVLLGILIKHFFLGVFSLTYAWTFNRASKMKEVANYFNGIITNYPGTMAKIIKEQGIRLATPDDELPLTTKKHVITSTRGYDCSCKSKRIGWIKRGCVISKAAPKNLACQCKKTLWWCKGSIVACSDPYSSACKKPNLSRASCQQGRGNCKGY